MDSILCFGDEIIRRPAGRFGPGEVAGGNYSTTFSAPENPIYEGGAWINGGEVGLDWNNVQVESGIAHGLQTGADGYDDSVALLAGTWGPTQTVEATVYSINQSTSYFEEVELWLRGNISAHSITGYEVTFRCILGGGYVQIVRWNGPLGNYTYVNNTPNGNYNGIQTDDVVRAEISGTAITVYVNDVEVIAGSDGTYSGGRPGIGFYNEDATGRNAEYGFKDVSAVAS